MLPKSIQNLIDEFSRLPGVGPKTAARLAFYLLTKPESDIKRLGDAVLGISSNMMKCEKCFNYSEDEICKICSDERRSKNILAVVEEPLDVIALEKSGGFSGLYHVLGGSISPIDGIGPEELKITELLQRLDHDNFSEIILATNPDLEGEATAAYVKDKINQKGLTIEITRIARGLPVGGDLEYADEVTLKRSLEGRKDYN
jgi:recombination protein RecR